MAKRINPMAPYFVQMRDAERRLLTGTLDACRRGLPVGASHDKQVTCAAELLGVHAAYIRVRARVLGGVFDGDPKREPPTSTATEVWLEENRAGRTRSPAAKPRKRRAAPAAEPEPTVAPTE